MRSNSKQGFVLSVMLHVGVAVAVVLISLYQPPDKPKKHVFELVSAPPPPAESSESVADPVEFSLPTPRPEPPRPPVRRPDPPPPQPTPRPTPVPVVQQPPPKPPEPKPVVPPPKPVTLEEFLKQQGPRKPAPPRTTPPKPVTVPRIDTKFSANLRNTVIDFDSITLSDAQQSALDGYISRLREALRRAWDKPTGLARTTSATVDFEVAANGRVSGARISRGSGNAMFDRSVLDAFDRVSMVGATPDGRPLRLRLTFDLTEM